MHDWFFKAKPEWQSKVLDNITRTFEDLQAISEQVAKWQQDIWFEELKGELLTYEVDGEVYFRKVGTNRAKVKMLYKKIYKYISYTHQISEAMVDLACGDYKKSIYRDRELEKKRKRRV